MKKLIIALMFSLVSMPAFAQVHPSCAATPPTGTGPLSVITSPVALYFEYPDTDWASITSGTVIATRVGAASPTVTIPVAKTAITRLGNGSGAMGCFSIAPIPVDQFPRGIPLSIRFSVTGAEALLASDPSNAIDPLGRRLQAGVLRGTP
jgi:hypothetical protein